MSERNIILTGFMGTGKSTLGRQLAKKLNYRFIDTDHLIEERLGMTISEYFASEGEAAFRELEANLVRVLSREKNLVIATGGGLVLNPANVRHLQETGRIICLTASPQAIYERISRQPDSRPLLKDPDPLQRIIELLAERKSVYDQFEQLSTDSGNRAEILEELLTRLQQDG